MNQIYIVAKPEFVGKFVQRPELVTLSKRKGWKIFKPFGWTITKIGSYQRTERGNTIIFSKEVSYKRTTFLEHLWRLIKDLF